MHMTANTNTSTKEHSIGTQTHTHNYMMNEIQNVFNATMIVE